MYTGTYISLTWLYSWSIFGTCLSCKYKYISIVHCTLIFASWIETLMLFLLFHYINESLYKSSVHCSVLRSLLLEQKILYFVFLLATSTKMYMMHVHQQCTLYFDRSFLNRNPCAITCNEASEVLFPPYVKVHLQNRTCPCPALDLYLEKFKW